MGRIKDLLNRATYPMDTVGQVHASQQLATVEVPWLLEYIEELEERLAGADREPQPLRTASGL